MDDPDRDFQLVAHKLQKVDGGTFKAVAFTPGDRDVVRVAGCDNLGAAGMGGRGHGNACQKSSAAKKRCKAHITWQAFVHIFLRMVADPQ